MDVYEIEDLILNELRKMAGFQGVDDVDVALVHFKGFINIARIAESLHTQLREKGFMFTITASN